MIEHLYEEVLLEESIKDWIKEHKQILKQLLTELTVYFGWPISAFTMGHYVSEFLDKNFPDLSKHLIQKIAHFIAHNPQILDLVK